MEKTIIALLALFLFISCNKDTNSIEAPPFSVYPNPFTDSFGLFISPTLGTQTTTSIKVLNGKDEAISELESVMPGDNLQINMTDQEKGIYYVELTNGGNTFNMAIVKAE